MNPLDYVRFTHFKTDEGPTTRVYALGTFCRKSRIPINMFTRFLMNELRGDILYSDEDSVLLRGDYDIHDIHDVFVDYCKIPFARL